MVAVVVDLLVCVSSNVLAPLFEVRRLKKKVFHRSHQTGFPCTHVHNIQVPFVRSLHDKKFKFKFKMGRFKKNCKYRMLHIFNYGHIH